MSEFSIVPGNFIEPSSAHHFGATNDVDLDEIWGKVGPCFGYLKPDGWRIQIHRSNNKVSLFSRTGNDYSTTFGAITSYIRTNLGEHQFILDTELLGYDHHGNHLSPARMQNAARHKIMLIDALYLDNDDITTLTTLDRNQRIIGFLRPYFSTDFLKADYKEILSVDDLLSLYKDFIYRQKDGYDGVILKKKKSSYFVDAIKIKSELTLDLVMAGVYLRNDNKIQAILVAVRDDQTNLLIPVAKVTGQGAEWEDACSVCISRILPETPSNILPPPTTPDHYLVPEVIVQITARSISKGAHNSYIIRVDAPRNLFLRNDKDLNTSTSFDTMCEMAGIPRPAISLGLFGNGL